MSDEIQIEGKPYISSKRAAQISGYAQDYIGQLARKALIDAKRVGGLWYIQLESLTGYQKKAEEYKPQPPLRETQGTDPETLVFFDGKEYLSASRAAEVSGYTQDYVGQLARGGTILSQQVGNRWYVEKQSIREHRAQKDSLLAAVQSQSVGLAKSQMPAQSTPSAALGAASEEVMRYFNEGGDLMPVVGTADEREKVSQLPENTLPELQEKPESTPIAIRKKVFSTQRTKTALPAIKRVYGNRPAAGLLPAERNRSYLPMVMGAAATIIIVLSVGYVSILKQNSVYAANIRQMGNLGSMPADVSTAATQIGDILEPYLTHELQYQRQNLR